MHQPIADGYSERELRSECRKTLHSIRSNLEGATDISDIVLAFVNELDAAEHLDEDIPDEIKNSDTPALVYILLGNSIIWLEQLEEVSDTDFIDPIFELANDLSDQELLAEAALVITAYFANGKKECRLYANNLIQNVLPMSENIFSIEEADSIEIRNLTSIYRAASTSYEHGSLPTVTLIRYLENGEADIDKIRNLRLDNILDQIEGAKHIGFFGKLLKSEFRNAVSHGGSSGIQRNPVNNTVTLYFRSGENRESKTLSFEEYMSEALQAASGAIALNLFPLILLLFAVEDKVSDHSENC